MTKLSLLLFVAAFAATFTQTAFALPVKQNLQKRASYDLAGFATKNGGTTGGNGGKVVTVKTVEDFTKAVEDDSPRIVKVSGILQISDQIDIGSHKTVVGADGNSGFTGGGLRIKEATNVIIRNLKLSFPKDTDAITIQKSTNVWIDHNDFWSDLSHGKDYYDGLLDISHASDWITVSWNKFHDHWKVSLVGHSDNNGDEDIGTLHVTYHHNHFYNVNTRTASIRFGTGHFYNNFFETAESAIHSRMGAQVLVEGNVWKKVTHPVMTTGDSDEDGEAVVRNNDYGGAKPEITKTCDYTKSDYPVTIDALKDVTRIVNAGAGTGVITL